MLTKLLKHEFRATARIMGPLYLVLLAVALGFNFSARLMDSGNFVLNMLAALVVMAYVVAITAVFIVAFILMLQRFYKNLLGDEGYLMFTLPASVSQHITAKLVVAVLLDVLSVAAAILAVLALAIVLTGVGVALTVNMRLVPNPGDGIVQAVAQRMGRDQGFAKNVFDLGCVAATVCLGLLLTGRIVGIGLGTLLAMVGVGRVIALVNHWTKAGMSRLAGVA